MAKKNHHHKKQKQNPVVPLAVGLLLIGLAFIWVALSNTKSDVNAKGKQISSGALSVSFPAPELSLENIKGKTESLTDYRQTVVLLNNWATWCPPCKAEMPVLETYYEDHAKQGFMIIAVEAGDAKEPVARFAQDYQLQFQLWLDPNGASLRAFGNGNLPNSYVIDRSGTVRYTWTGEVNRTTLEKYVTPLLAE